MPKKQKLVLSQAGVMGQFLAGNQPPQGDVFRDRTSRLSFDGVYLNALKYTTDEATRMGYTNTEMTIGFFLRKKKMAYFSTRNFPLTMHADLLRLATAAQLTGTKVRMHFFLWERAREEGASEFLIYLHGSMLEEGEKADGDRNKIVAEWSGIAHELGISQHLALPRAF